ncbi:MAG: hypothetical protein ACRDKE_03790, partial [Solirubrobacterales bacterium]
DVIFVDQLRAEPGVASVTEIESEDATQDTGAGYVPTAADIASADGVVLKNDCRWADSVALGNLMADFQDRGGVVVADTWNFWDEANDPGYSIRGRWASGGYSPFVQLVNGTATVQALGSHDAAHPFFQGVTGLVNATTYADTALAPGATQLASWANGALAVAVKGRAVALNGFIGDTPENAGNHGRFVVNAFKALGPRALTVGRAGGGKGAVSSSAGAIVCALTCDGMFLAGTPMMLSAKAAKGSAFTGWAGACTGRTACAYTVGYPGVTATLWNNAPITANFASTKLKYGKFKTGKLSVTLPGAGKLIITGSGIKKISKTVKKKGTAKLAVKATGNLKKKLDAGKTVKVKFKFAFTPTGAAKSTKTSKSITLKK